MKDICFFGSKYLLASAFKVPIDVGGAEEYEGHDEERDVRELRRLNQNKFTRQKLFIDL